MFHEVGISFEELKYMNLSDGLERVYKYIEYHNPNKKPPVRMATQEDIDRF